MCLAHFPRFCISYPGLSMSHDVYISSYKSKVTIPPNWDDNQPDDWQDDEDCTEMIYNGKWNDINCSNEKFKYICKTQGMLML